MVIIKFFPIKWLFRQFGETQLEGKVVIVICVTQN